MMASLIHVLSLVYIYLVLAPTAGASRLWNLLGKRALSPDNTCGNVGAGSKNGFVCNPALIHGGKCCSANGYCGNSYDYCGPGCQAAFGTCDTSLANTDLYLCGPQNGGLSCAEYQCCSSAGYCGNSTDYCGAGCQSKYGRCGTSGISSGSGSLASTTSFSSAKSTGSAGTAVTGLTSGSSLKGTQTANTSKATKTSTPGGACGAGKGGASCIGGECCSSAGWCGKSKDYCADPDCQFQYGICDSNKTPAGQSTLDDPRPALGKVTYDNDIYDCVKSQVVALTFDDGPYLYTSAILDVLKKFNFTGTFFVTGNNDGKGMIDITAPYPALVRRMIAEGHQVASHTWSHYSLDNITSQMRMEQMSKNERAIANIIGKYPTYMRPPYSQCAKASGCWADLKKLGYHRVYFDLDTQDYLHPLPSQIQTSKDIVKSYITGSKSGGANNYLSIQHDVIEESVNSLSSYYYGLIRDKGWKGVTVGECLNDPESNWYRKPGASGATSLISSISTNLPASLKKANSSSTGNNANSSAIVHSTTISASTTSSKMSAANSTSSANATSSTCSLTTEISMDSQMSGMPNFNPSNIPVNSSTIATIQAQLPTTTTASSRLLSNITSSDVLKTGDNMQTIGPTKSGPTIATSAGVGYAYVGCFSDAPDDRAVHGAGYKLDQTVEECAKFCANSSAPVFAVEYHSECFCGHDLNKTRARSTGCNLTCYGDSNEICGGMWAAQVYSLNQSSSTSTTATSQAGSSLTSTTSQTDVGPNSTLNVTLALSQNVSSSATTSANVSTAAGESNNTALPTLIELSSSTLSTANVSANMTATIPDRTISTTSNVALPSNSSTRRNASDNPTPTPTSTCAVAMKDFCGTFQQFDNEDACWDAVTDCTNQITTCYNGIDAVDTESPCSDYTDKCISLFWYCRNCTATCSSDGFSNASLYNGTVMTNFTST